MSGILKSKVSTYEFGLGEVKMMIAADLGRTVEEIEVEYVIQEVGGDPMDRWPGRQQVTKIRVTVKDPV